MLDGETAEVPRSGVSDFSSEGHCPRVVFCTRYFILKWERIKYVLDKKWNETLPVIRLKLNFTIYTSLACIRGEVFVFRHGQLKPRLNQLGRFYIFILASFFSGLSPRTPDLREQVFETRVAERTHEGQLNLTHPKSSLLLGDPRGKRARLLTRARLLRETPGDESAVRLV